MGCSYFPFLKNDIILSHADRYHHCHTWPDLEDVLVKVLKRHNLSKVRSIQRVPDRNFTDKIVNSLSKILFNFGINKIAEPHKASRTHALQQYERYFTKLKESDIKSTDYLCSYSTLCDCFVSGYNKANFGLLELMCRPEHPFYKEEEQELLCDYVHFKQLSIVDLISYKEI